MATFKYLNSQRMICFIKAESVRDAAEKLREAEVRYMPGSLEEIKSDRPKKGEEGR